MDMQEIPFMLKTTEIELLLTLLTPSLHLDCFDPLPYRDFSYQCSCSLCQQPHQLPHRSEEAAVTCDELRYLPLGPTGRWQSSLGAEAMRRAEAALAEQAREDGAWEGSRSSSPSESPSEREGAEATATAGREKRGRSWSEEERERHKKACRGKGRLSARERQEIENRFDACI
ncbi:hypothetical protein GUITHDRAFT_149284 [Guillardia theta CCMP2712]|uniref:Uncharacterized protein n=1 Tax=Guillardia theta (strain CCMP2712) TaxID=905079 RepID=L1I5C5_GUITC|nr:hypothetical protein GUITHDRAFT_149284 [Guillardia theta CCMP2712]EKX31468.1 hypothetical protein GUITHDRAFT_149284 [Guillardia theta CCMP2712]|eukprot:XP_005818448.1 hypothetical protein GUITHDRAFT_149284 [Guillardia theta CCMP2712]